MALASWERRALALRVDALLREMNGLRDRLDCIALDVQDEVHDELHQSCERSSRGD
jgi:hypothetical protein